MLKANLERYHHSCICIVATKMSLDQTLINLQASKSLSAMEQEKRKEKKMFCERFSQNATRINFQINMPIAYLHSKKLV
jgi:penicillin-binding protein-related factor A (putative recombinase)